MAGASGAKTALRAFCPAMTKKNRHPALTRKQAPTM
jgi:hypothetical protein